MSDLKQHLVALGLPIARTKPIKDLQEEDLKGVELHSVANLLSLCVAFGIIATGLMAANAKAQEAEPRAYTNTPVGLNFLIAGYVYAEGKMAFDPDLAIADANFHSNTEVLAYVRSFDIGGQSAKFDVIVPASSFSAQGIVNGQPREREMSGLGDPRFRVSVNLFGAPALSVKDFAS